MDAKRLGPLIAARRKELGITQKHLAEKLHVTDKAVSRWERGIGLPDINTLEGLSAALDLSLVELVQTRRNQQTSISTEEAEKLLADTIELNRATAKSTKRAGVIILSTFLAISLLFLPSLIFSGESARLSTISLITGLIAWGIPIWHMTLARTSRKTAAAILSFSFALLSVMLQFGDISHRAHNGDWSGIADTIDALIRIVKLFGTVTLFLNLFMAVEPDCKEDFHQDT